MYNKKNETTALRKRMRIVFIAASTVALMAGAAAVVTQLAPVLAKLPGPILPG